MIGMTAEDYRQAQADAMTEAQLQAAILGTPRRPGLADTLGWLGYHTHRSDRSPAGFPDVVAVRGNRVIFAELKRQKRSNPTPAQVAWLEALKGTPAEVYLWRPMDLLDGTVERVLK